MKFKLLLPIISLLIFLGGCSASYKQLSKMENKEPKNFQEHLLSEYKKRASFEAEEMHDWNSAKLYSEKALKSLETDEIYPEEISYWKIPEENINEIMFEFDDGGVKFNRGFFLKTESAEVIINQLILHGISNDPVGNPFAKA